MGDLRVIRWARHGKERYYVKDASGVDLGWVDGITGVVTASAELTSVVAEAVDNFRGLADRLQPPAPAADPEWTDLALNRPGQAARERAEEERAAMREQSRVGAWVARALDVKTDERAWRVGADGEEAVGDRLDRLTMQGWHVLHAVPVGSRGSDIDHVLIGPGGVYTVNTKTHRGKKVWVGGDTIMISGQRVPYVRNSEFEAERAERLLSKGAGFPVVVRPVIVFITGTLIPDVTIKSPPQRVVILDRTDIPGAFRKAPARLSEQQRDAVYAAARRSTTWA